MGCLWSLLHMSELKSEADLPFLTKNLPLYEIEEQIEKHSQKCINLRLIIE